MPPPPKPSPQQYTARGEWLQAKEVVKLVDKAKAHAELSIPELRHGAFAKKGAAAEVQEALLACLSFGYLPPLRGVCLRTTQLSTFVEGAPSCIYDGCQGAGCTGNRLLRATLADGTSSYTLHLQHHKVASTKS